MNVTLAAYGRAPVEADQQGAGLWLEPASLPAATGWELKPEGMCRGEACVPIPPSRRAEFLDGKRFNLLAFARLMDQPVVEEPEAAAWVIGEAAGDRRARLESAEAPDFDLPDLAGKQHRLSSYRGKKVIVVTWASW